MTARLRGYLAVWLEPPALQAAFDAAPQPGRRFLAAFDAARWPDALAAAAAAGCLDAAASCAFAEVALKAGAPAGFIDLAGADGDEVRFAVGAASRDVLGEGADARLLVGGFAGRVPDDAWPFGSMPLEDVARGFDARALEALRHDAQAPWLSEWLNLLESAAVVAARQPGAHLLLVPEWEAASRETPDEGPGAGGLRLMDVLQDAVAMGASDVALVPGAPPMAHGPFGRRPLHPEPLTREAARALALAFVPEPRHEALDAGGTFIGATTVRGVARCRVAVTPGAHGMAASLRLLPQRPPAVEALSLPGDFASALPGLTRGLVVIGGPPGGGRSTTLAALCQSLLDAGASVATLEAPVSWALSSLTGLVRQVDVAEASRVAPVARALGLGPVDVLAVDLVDETEACEVALAAAAEGRLVLLALRGLSVSALVHRLVAADGAMQRRRLAEHLAAVLWQRLMPNVAHDGWKLEASALLPSEALRRHLRALDTMPPPAVLEPSADDAS